MRPEQSGTNQCQGAVPPTDSPEQQSVFSGDTNCEGFLQSLSEAELTELVLMPLLEKMGYTEIRSTHGIIERGKDIVFARQDPLSGLQYLAATVKCRALRGSVAGSQSIHEVLFQLRQALREPYLNPLNGQQATIEEVFCITPFPVPQVSVESIGMQLRDLANRVRFIDGPQLLSLVRRYIPDILLSLSDPESRYLHHLCLEFLSSSPLGGLGVSRRMRVHDLYVVPSLSEITKEDARYVSFAEPPQLYDKLLPHTRLPEEQCAVVLADVGGGKTTLLQRLVIEAAGNRKNASDGPVPLFVPLAHLGQSDVESSLAARDAIAGYVEREYGIRLRHLGKKEGGHYLLLLDGFDELIGHHDQVETCIEELLTSGVAVIVTSRPSSLPDLRGFRYYRLNPLTEDDIRQFLGRWFVEQPSVAAQVSARILGSSPLLDLCRTPLMLTLYAILSSEASVDALPTRRTDVYESIVGMLLGGWDRLRHIRSSFSTHAKQQFLEKLAYSVHLERQRTFTSQAALEAAMHALRSRNRRSQTRPVPSALVLEVVFRSSLLRPADRHEVRGTRLLADPATFPYPQLEFTHMSFQEYFCALALLRHGSSREIARLVGDQWWENTLAFYFGICRSIDVLFAAGPTSQRHWRGLTLLKFLAEADFTEPDTREKVLQIAGREILGERRISAEGLAVCRRLGDDVVDAVESALSEKAPGLRADNVFRVLFSVHTRKSHQLIEAHKDLLAQLDIRQLVSVLVQYMPSVSLSGVEFAVAGFDSLAKACTAARSADWAAVRGLVSRALEEGENWARHADPKGARAMDAAIRRARSARPRGS